MDHRRWIGGLVALIVGLSAGHAAAQPTCPPLYKETQALTSSWTSYGAVFGYDVAVDGTVMAVGMPNSRYGYPKVAVYELADDVWVHVQDLYPPDNVTSAFGKAVAVSGTRILVGDPVFGGGGAVFLYEKQNGTWVPHADNPIQWPRLKPGEQFGHAVAISGDRFVVGAPLHDAGYTTGMAFLYLLQNGSWNASPLVPSSSDYGAYRYGHAVAIDGVLIAVGAPEDIGRNSEPAAGRVSVFEDIGSWTLTKRVAAPTSEANARFGTSVAVSGQEVLIGEPYRSGYYVQGQVYLFERDAVDADVYHQAATLLPDYYCGGGYTFAFGYDVAFDGSTALIGSPEYGPDAEGLAYLFRRRGGYWTETAHFVASNTNRQAQVGYAVALSGATSVVGAPFYGAQGAGAAFVFDAVQLGLRRTAAPEAAPLARETPAAFGLAPNYPNPFNPITRLRYDLPAAGPVTLRVYNPIGQVVATLVDAVQEAGTYTVSFDARGLPSGPYVVRLQAGDRQASRLVALLN